MNFAVPISQEIRQKLPWLVDDFGFQVVEESFDPAAFGDSFVTLKSSFFLLRFVRDRGQIFIEIATLYEPQRWWNLSQVNALINREKVDSEFDLTAQGSLLQRIMPELIDRFSGPKSSETLLELERQAEKRKKALLKSLSK